MKFIADFIIKAWVKDLIIEAKSEEEAKAKLKSMSLQELMDQAGLGRLGKNVEDAWIKNFCIEEEAIDFFEAKYKVKVFNIEYDLDDKYVVKDDIANLPSTREYTLISNTDSILSGLIMDELFFETGFNVKHFDFEIIKKF